MNDPRQIVIRPLVTEKGMFGAEKDRAYPFEVHKSANKAEIRDAIQKLFEVTVTDVRTMNMQGKSRRRRFKMGRTRSWKKAIVKLAKNDTIEII